MKCHCTQNAPKAKTKKAPETPVPKPMTRLKLKRLDLQTIKELNAQRTAVYGEERAKEMAEEIEEQFFKRGEDQETEGEKAETKEI